MSTRHEKTLLIEDGGDWTLAVRTTPPDPTADPPEPLEVIAFADSGSIDDENARCIKLTREDAVEIGLFIANALGVTFYPDSRGSRDE